MKKLIVFCLLVSLILVKCYTPSEFGRDQNIMVLNKSMNSITNSQSLKPIGLCNVKKSTVNYLSADGCERKSKVDHEVILGILIGGGLGALAILAFIIELALIVNASLKARDGELYNYPLTINFLK